MCVCHGLFISTGRECKNILLLGNSSGSIQCTTPSQPPLLPYYPGNTGWGIFPHVFLSLVCNGHMSGGRGLLREVWIGGDYGDIDRYPLEPRSQLVSIQDKAYRDHSYTRDFGERNNFIQRYTGFFVPPVTSLYTFSILSDDLSRWYISPSMNPDEKKLVAYADIHTSGQWNRYESQTSAPMMMERGQYYYMEVYSNQYFGES